MATKRDTEDDVATVPSPMDTLAMFNPMATAVALGDAYLKSLKSRTEQAAHHVPDAAAAAPIEAVNHDMMMLIQKQMEVCAVSMNLWAHLWALPFRQQS